MPEQLRLGLVGCGRLAERGYLPAIRRAKGVRLGAVADPVQSRCLALAAEAPRYESAAEMLAAGGLGAVILATPAGAHVADARLAAAAGLPALVEKPPAPDAASARELAGLEPMPWVGFNRRFEPGLERLRASVPAGEEVELSLELHQHDGGWGSHVVTEDALAGLGSHLIDLARWLTGSEIVRVRALQLDQARALVELELDRGSARVSCGVGGFHRDRIEVNRPGGGRVARRVADGRGRRALIRLRRPRLNALVALLVGQLEELASACRGLPAPRLATAADGAAVMASIDAARRSSQSRGEWRAVD